MEMMVVDKIAVVKDYFEASERLVKPKYYSFKYDYRCGKKIGYGGSATVYQADRVFKANSSQQVAIKLIDLKKQKKLKHIVRILKEFEI